MYAGRTSVTIKASFKDEAMRTKMMRGILAVIAVVALTGCTAEEPKYGTETQVSSPLRKRQIWAVAPAVNLSGYPQVDPLLHGDNLFQQLQQVDGVTAIPVNRVVQVFASLRIEQVQSAEQASLVCDVLGCDGLLVPTVTAYDPYDPPKLGAAIQLFRRAGYARAENVSPRELARRASPGKEQSLQTAPDFLQTVGMFDAASGSVRQAVYDYARGRNDPLGPMGAREYFASMDRYSGFVYHTLIAELMKHPKLQG